MAIPFSLASAVSSGSEALRPAHAIATPPLASAPTAEVPSAVLPTPMPDASASAVATTEGARDLHPMPVAAPDGAAEAVNDCVAGQPPRFVTELADLKRALGAQMGDPLEYAHINAENGDVLQQTTTGLAFFRPSTRTPVFTDGYIYRALMWGAVLPWSETSLQPQSEAATLPAADPEPTAEAVASSVEYWTVSVVTHLDSTSDAHLAQLTVHHLESRGLPAEVLPSAYHLTVRPGLLVVSSGRFDSSTAASSHLALLRSIGFADAYPTHVVYQTTR